MKFQLGSKVIYKGEEAEIFDYDHRYKDYTLVVNNKRIYNVREDEIC